MEKNAHKVLLTTKRNKKNENGKIWRLIDWNFNWRARKTANEIHILPNQNHEEEF